MLKQRVPYLTLTLSRCVKTLLQLSFTVSVGLNWSKPSTHYHFNLFYLNLNLCYKGHSMYLNLLRHRDTPAAVLLFGLSLPLW